MSIFRSRTACIRKGLVLWSSDAGFSSPAPTNHQMKGGFMSRKHAPSPSELKEGPFERTASIWAQLSKRLATWPILRFSIFRFSGSESLWIDVFSFYSSALNNFSRWWGRFHEFYDLSSFIPRFFGSINSVLRLLRFNRVAFHSFSALSSSAFVFSDIECCAMQTLRKEEACWRLKDEKL